MTLYSRRYIHTEEMDLTAGHCTATFNELLCTIPEDTALSNEFIRVSAPLNFLDIATFTPHTHTVDLHWPMRGKKNTLHFIS